MKIVALDPGGTTGLAWINLDPLLDDPTVHHEQIGPNEHHVELLNRLQQLRPDIMVYERFLYQQRDKVNLISCEYIGVIKLYWRLTCNSHPKVAHLTHPVVLVKQTPAQMDFWTDNKLRAVDLYIPGQPHAVDATRHLLYYMSFTRKDKRWILQLRGSGD